MINRRTIYFNEGPVVTGLLPTGEYGARRQDECDEHVLGVGHTRLAAIADLNRLIGELDEIEEIDHQANRFDHARDLRKNWEPTQ